MKSLLLISLVVFSLADWQDGYYDAGSTA